MDDDSGEATTLFFTLQVTDRVHLARILRALRRIPEVVRITRYVDKRTDPEFQSSERPPWPSTNPSTPSSCANGWKSIPRKTGTAEGRALWWDKAPQPLEAMKEVAAAKVPNKAYYYDAN
jgi:hypothetical protein